MVIGIIIPLSNTFKTTLQLQEAMDNIFCEDLHREYSCMWQGEKSAIGLGEPQVLSGWC